jgi:hypothetical protein
VIDARGAVPDELSESSGLAVSRTQPGVLWSHNDSGDGPVLYAIDESGRLLATVQVTGASAVDWEDIASGPCPSLMRAAAGEQCLFVADTGDNERTRDVLTIYLVIEPKLDGAGRAPAAVEARSIRYRYPDQPHDAEAIAVLADGDVTVVTKGRTGAIEFFGLPGASVGRALTSGETLTAQYRGDSGITPDATVSRLVTAAAVSPDGSTLAVRTYDEVFFFGAVRSGSDGVRFKDLGRPCFLGDAEPQGEAIDYLDADTLLLTSERSRGRPGPIHRVRC